MDRGPMRRRMDFVMIPRTVEGDTIEVELVPDPARYEWREFKGKRWLCDKLDDSAMEESVFLEGFAKLSSLPIHYQPPRISDAAAYVAQRIPDIRSRLLGDVPPASFASPSEQFLRSIQSDAHDFVILSLDIVGSTQRATSLPRREYVATTLAVIGEAAEVVSLFGGHILKHTGDGFIAYFPAPAFIGMHDLALDCARTLRRLIYHGFNPVMRSLQKPALAIRIGLDSGTIAVVPVGSPSTKQERDLIGEVVSLACKIQGLADPGQIALGDVTLRNVHGNVRRICSELTPLPDKWYPDPDTEGPYRVYIVQDPNWSEVGASSSNEDGA